MIPRPKGMEERERSRPAQAYQIERCRFRLTGTLDEVSGSTATAMVYSWDKGSNDWRDVTEIIVANDDAGMFHGSSPLKGRAEFMPDIGLWEIYQLEC